jgi:Ca-activated chloride channel family protein
MDFRHPHFAEPAWLWLLLIGPLALFALQYYAANARKKQISLFAAPELLPALLRSHGPLRRIIKSAMLLLCVTAIATALARPQWGETSEISRALGEDIMFVLDCSKSMLATDIRPSRLGRAKFAILDFVQRHGRGRVGLVAFAGGAFLECPLTFDYDAFRDSLMSVDEHTIPVAGTDIGRGLQESALSMEKSDRRKIIVLVTDGEDLEASGVKIARSLGEKGIVVYTIGVGTAAGSPIPIINERGMSDYLRDSSGAVVTSHLDEATLTAIAQATHGAYHPLGGLGEGLNQVRHLVENSTEVTDFSKVRKLGVDRFHVPIAAAIVLLVTESLIGTRRKLRQNNT